MATYGQRERAEEKSLERALAKKRQALAELPEAERRELEAKRDRVLKALAPKN